jgi:hypothetical protein
VREAPECDRRAAGPGVRASIPFVVAGDAAPGAHALAYVLGNWRKHGEARAGERIDRYSSAFALPDWSSGPVVFRKVPLLLPVALPRTWLLAEGWRLAGPISPWVKPGPA